jgi:pimeloyl-ACP methyl ester carboxylesterase
MGARLVFTPRAVLCAALCAAASGLAATPPTPSRHLIYLHGRIVQEQQSSRPKHPQFGFYELDAILDAFRARGFVVSGEIRPKAITVEDAADHVVDQVKRLRASGVPGDRITVVGASMGASIALLAATRLHDPDLRFAVLGECLSENVRSLATDEGRAPAGHILSIREKSDELSEPCPAWTGASAAGSAGAPGAAPAAAPDLVAREIVLDTGLRHGFLYRPLPEWVDPVAAWARGEERGQKRDAAPATGAPGAKSGTGSTRPGA